MSGERILVVDDDDSIRQVVSLFLNDEGYDVVTVAHGQAALDVVDAYQPHIILLDLRMPVMDGWDFVRIYRARPGPHAAIVAFVATLNAEQERSSVDAAAVLPKPFDLEELLAAVAEARASLSWRPVQANT